MFDTVHDMSPMRILIVDGAFESRWGIADALSLFLQAVAIESAASGEEALAAVERRQPDLVLAAQPMPEMDGFELARRIKALPDAPVVALMTERSDAQFEAQCEAAGVDFWFEKRHLQARLLAFLQQRFNLRLAPSRRRLP